MMQSHLHLELSHIYSAHLHCPIALIHVMDHSIIHTSVVPQRLSQHPVIFSVNLQLDNSLNPAANFTNWSPKHTK